MEDIESLIAKAKAEWIEEGRKMERLRILGILGDVSYNKHIDKKEMPYICSRIKAIKEG